MTILIVVALALAVMAYISYPLWAAEPKRVVGTKSASSRSGRERVEALPSPDAEELDLDRQAGRLDEQEYAALVGAPPAPAEAQLQSQDDEIERRVRALRQERARQRSQPQSKNQER